MGAVTPTADGVPLSPPLLCWPFRYKSPTGMVDMTFQEWLRHAKEAESAPVESPHFYMQLGSRPPNEFIANDLPDFQPHKNFFIIDNKGACFVVAFFGGPQKMLSVLP